jgi:antitoxin YefM
MTRLNATDARSRLYSLIDETVKTHQPVVITGKRGNAVLVTRSWSATWTAPFRTESISSIDWSIKRLQMNALSRC